MCFGIIQFQYHREDPEVGDATDEVFFRRLRPYIAGSLYENWYGKFQIDYGKSSVAVKDAFFRYSGWPNMKLAIGNHNFPFSREFLTSSKQQQLVERTFVGDHNYGTPDRNMGVHLTGSFMDKKVTYGVSAASANIDPSSSKLDWDTPANNPGNDGWNEGPMIGGRIDWHPLGYLKMEQGDFKRKTLATIGAAAYSWNNNGDFDTGANDVDSVTGFEISGALRGFGLSVDAQYNLFDAKATDQTLTGGIYKNGESNLSNYALEGGYMLPYMLEIVAGYQVQTADNYAKDWTRASLGLNYFIKKHDIKLQGTYRIGANKDGIDGNDLHELFIQAQFVF
jgi:hypothetical protein